MKSTLRVFSILVYLLFPVLATRELASNTTSQVQITNDTQSVRDLEQSNRYPKLTTKLNSVSIDPVVSFLNVQSGQTADLPLTSLSKLNQRSDFTVMFWFKVEALPNPGRFTQIFSIQKTLSCFIDSLPTIQCDSAGIEPLRVSSNKIVEGKWNHLTVSFFADTQTGYLMISDDMSEPAISYSKDASIIQAVGQWSACIGMCIQKRSGFAGGVRDFLVRSRYILPNQAQINKNEIAIYSQDIRAYYRFSYDSSQFFNDQFVSRTFYWRTGTQNQTIDNWRGAEMIPVNVCPRTFNYTQLYRFDLAQQLRLIQLSSSAAKATKYSYYMSVTFYKNSSSCFTQDIKSAQNGCNLVMLEQVFMLYFQSANSARFFFYATKNFYQSQSTSFFIPNNQWITVKLFMNQQNGYQIYVLDHNQNTLAQLSKQYDMQQQQPSKKLYLFQSLVGYVGSFTLSEENYKVPSAKYTPTSPILKLDFRPSINQNGLPSEKIQNSGGNRQPALMMFAPVLDLVVSPYQPLSTDKIFDGITCNDGHQVLSFSNDLSYLNFTTAPLEFIDNTQNSSIEFWFKFQNPSTYNSTSSIFQMIDPYVDPFEHNYTYWVIFLNNSALNVAPFGLGNINETAVITFQDLNLANEDKLGWWHIACSFQFNVSIECFLSNSISKFQNGYSMVNVVKAFPTYSLDAHFGFYKGTIYSPRGMLLKEVRIWKKVLTEDDVKAKKQLQIDPTYDDDILVYLRLNSLKNAFFNSVKLNKLNSFDTVGSYQLISQVPDMTQIVVTRYNEISGLLEFATEPQSHVVCPAYTYLKDNLCYSEPVNEAVLAVFPFWDLNSGTLTWTFTLQYSSLIDNSFLDFLTFRWSTDDQVLQKLFESNRLIHTIQSNHLRQESLYAVSAAIQNPAITFSMASEIRFIPNSCQWFEVDGFDATTAYQLVQELPGQQDLTFTLILKQSTAPSCNQRNFYNAFSSLSFEYFVSGGAQRVGVQPKANYTLSSEQNFQDITQASDLKVNVIIPASELGQMPTFTDIRILMAVHWTSSLYPGVWQDSENDPIFQHVLYTVNYQTPDSTLLSVYVTPKSSVIAINQTLVIDASNTTTRNIDMQFAIIAYSWQCPYYFEQYCKSQSGNKLTVPWQVFHQSNAPFGEYHQFQATVALVKDNQVIFLTTIQSQAMWYNIMKPEFRIDFRPNPILVSNPQDTRFNIVPINFDKSQFLNFTIQWQVYGQLAGRQSISFQNLSQVMVVPSDSWKINSTYSISCVLTYTQSLAISTNNSFLVNIYGPPFGGLAYISPKQGYLGDTFFIYLQGWESYLDTESIVYTVFTSLDDLGNQIGQQLTQRPLSQKETFYFVAQTTYPLIVKITDKSSEVTISRVVGTFLNGTNPALNQQSFAKSIPGGSRHLSEKEADELQLNGLQCNFYSQISQEYFLNQTMCRIQPIISLANEIANSTCPEYGLNKTFAVLKIYDSLVAQNSPCKSEINLRLTVLDLAVQFANSKLGLEVLRKAKEIQLTDRFDGTNLQIVSKKVSSSQNDTFRTRSVQYLASQQISLDWTQIDSDSQIQLITVQSNNFQSFTIAQIYNPDLQQTNSLSEYSGQITLNFDIIPELYQPNITICAVVQINDSNLSTESCLTQIIPSLFQITCTCNIMMVGEVVTLMQDYSRQLGSPVTFPDHQVVVLQSGIAQIKKSSYIFITVIGLISLYGLFGFAFAWKMDKSDKVRVLEDQQQVIDLVATRLQRPQYLVQHQMRELQTYMSCDSSGLFHVGKAIHPNLSPYTYFDISQSRALRFSTYHSQVNILVISILGFFGRHYRHLDHRFEEVLDLLDIQSVCYCVLLGSIWLIPTLANALNYVCQNNSINQPRSWRRGLIYTISFLLNFIIVFFAVYTAYQAPASNQYLIAISIAGSIIGSAVFTNTTRVLFNSFKLRFPLSYLQSRQAKIILEEVKCMRRIQQELDEKQKEKSSSADVQSRAEQELHEKQQTEQASIELSESGNLQTTRGLNEGFRE